MLSIVIPTFNGQDRIHAVVSDLLQVQAEIEIVVVDDGSNDRTDETLALFDDRRLKVYKTLNSGVAKARRFGLSKASFPWVLFIDDDDRVCASSISKIVPQLHSETSDILLFPYMYRKKLEETYKSRFCSMEIKDYRDKLFSSQNPYGVFLWNRIYRTNLAEQVFDQVGEWEAPGEDAVFNLRAAALASKIKCIDVYFVTYMIRSSSLSKNTDKITVVRYVKVLDLLLKNGSIGFWKYNYLLSKLDARSGAKRISGKLIGTFFIIRKNYEELSRALKSRIYVYSGIFSINSLEAYVKLFSVLSIEKTINQIENGKSISRFGDGEFRLMVDSGEIEFQVSDKNLSLALRNCFENPGDDVLNCIPNLSSKDQKFLARLTWASLLRDINVTKLRSVAIGGQTYGDALITRPFLGYRRGARAVFQFFNNFFSNKEILFLCGYSNTMDASTFFSLSRLKTIRVPNENAFCAYDGILQMVKAELNSKQYDIFIVSCGPVASLLSQEFAAKVQCIDIGHLHMEYEKSGISL
jgi:glycosyltransferase involved in cell wall biosynthesis